VGGAKLLVKFCAGRLNLVFSPGEMNYIYAIDEDKYGFSQIT